ncbi:MAG: 30S ribosomal protein S17 [Candidatus Marinimicrobia bacterium]|nr:30S ribosomal protein S17 [Candidatus Neomarinimicrobiota bacterium]
MSERGKRKVLQGIVTSNAMDKTIVVKVSRRLRHPLYGKFIKKSKSFKAHDEKNVSKVGDEVKIMESRPISKDKRWRLLETVKQALEV